MNMQKIKKGPKLALKGLLNFWPLDMNQVTCSKLWRLTGNPTRFNLVDKNVSVGSKYNDYYSTFTV